MRVDKNFFLRYVLCEMKIDLNLIVIDSENLDESI